MQAAALLPLCSELVDEDAARHCERNLHSYWAYLAPELYTANLATEEAAAAVCDMQYSPGPPCAVCTQLVANCTALFCTVYTGGGGGQAAEHGHGDRQDDGAGAGAALLRHGGGLVSVLSL